MPDNNDDSNIAKRQFLVLSDEQANRFAIPRVLVERYSLTGEQKQKLEQLMGEDVSGYEARWLRPLIDPPFMEEPPPHTEPSGGDVGLITGIFMVLSQSFALPWEVAPWQGHKPEVA